MAAKAILPWMGRPDCKVMLCFCSTTVLCILLLVVLYLNPDGNLIPSGNCGLLGPLSSSSSQNIQRAIATEEGNRQVVANPSSRSFLRREKKSSTSNGSRQQEEEEQEEVVKVLEEWRLPAVAGDRPHEKLEGPEAFGEPRRFLPLGSSGFLFVQFGAYRTAPNAFAVVGLGAKLIHKYSNPGFECGWVSSDGSILRGGTNKRLPDWGLGNQYSVVVVHCTFGSAVGADGSGGRLEFTAHHGGKDHTGIPDVHWVARTEDPNQYDGSVFVPPYKYDYLYCGSPLFGSISPQRIREWIAYHVWLFGPRSHFVFYDAGGVQADVQKVLQPWVDLGFVSVMNIRQQSRYDSYYYGQFLVNNDCLFKGKTLANWTFFFDVDEYMHVPAPFSFDEVMLGYTSKGRRAQQVHFKQNFFNNQNCRRNSSLDSGALERQWGFEKLVYRRTQKTHGWGFLNKKYAIQAQYALSTGVHNAVDTLNPPGLGHKETVVTEEVKMTYNHYHHTVDHHVELCQEFVDPEVTTPRLVTARGGADEADVSLHVLDLGMAVLADAVREFENRTVGQQPFLL